jgi:MFS transporter, DHA2 family, multidrug resistance protein
MNMHMSLDYAGDQMWVPNIVRAIGQALLLAPLAAVAMVGIAAQELGAASGVFNMMRNLGGAFGTAILATIVTKREQYQSNIIGSSVTLFREPVRDRIAHRPATSRRMAASPRLQHTIKLLSLSERSFDGNR